MSEIAALQDLAALVPSLVAVKLRNFWSERDVTFIKVCCFNTLYRFSAAPLIPAVENQWLMLQNCYNIKTETRVTV